MRFVATIREMDPMKREAVFRALQVFARSWFLWLGLTHMIGGLAQASTSILRQLIDAGTLSNLPAGFKARGARIRDEDNPFNRVSSETLTLQD